MAHKNQAELIDRNQHARHEARMQKHRSYRAYREGHAVTVGVFDGISMTPLPLRLDLKHHSPSGFQWGYGGSGPSQLALAICADALGDDAQALNVYQAFKNAHVALQTGDEWEISAEDVRAIVHRLSHAG